jgi:hypothetical protein
MIYNRRIASYSAALVSLVYLLTGCESTSSPPAEGVAVSSFDVECAMLVCSVDASLSVSQSDDLSSLVCDMGDGNPPIDLLTLEVVFDYTYSTPGSYDITCDVENTVGKRASSTVTVTADELVVNAGPDQTVSDGVTVTLDGSLSDDTNGGTINRYKWTNLPTNRLLLALTNPDSANPTFVAPFDLGGATVVYKFRLLVSIDDGVSYSNTSDIVEITVVPAGGSDLPS